MSVLVLSGHDEEVTGRELLVTGSIRNVTWLHMGGLQVSPIGVDTPGLKGEHSRLIVRSVIDFTTWLEPWPTFDTQQCRWKTTSEQTN